MDKKSRKKKHRKPLRDKIDSNADSLLYEIELDLYLECMRLDKKRKQKYIV